MATTTGGTTYVTSTDLVANYPTASLALANRVDVVASGGSNNVKTSGYTITLADILKGDKFLYNSASPGTFTLPASGLVDGMVVQIAQIGAGSASVTGGTIVGTTSTSAQYQGLQLIYASTGTTWYSVAPSVTAPGLAIVTPTSIANSGGTSSALGGAVTFTGVTSLSLNGVFSATYDNYRVVIRSVGSITGSGTPQGYMRMRAAGTDNTAAQYYKITNFSTTGSSGFEWDSATTAWNVGLGYDYLGQAVFDVASPFLSAYTSANFLSVSQGTAAAVQRTGSLSHLVSSSFDGFTIYPASGTTTGSIRVYGYKNS